MRYVHLAGGDSPLGAELADRVVRLGGVLPGINTLEDLVAAGPTAWATAAALAPTLSGVIARRLAAPLSRPSKIVCVGLNYRDHAIEQGIDLPKVPMIFAKFPSAIIGPGDEIAWPAGATDQVDFEAELAVVVGRRLDHADADEASAGVFGYTVANDVSARDLQQADVQFVRAKSLNTFLPLGPAVVTADEFGSPAGRWIRARLNGVLMQDSNTDQLIFSVDEILSFLSRHMTLLPGDVVLTGTPGGVGVFRDPPVFLRGGDVIEVEVEGIGVLRNDVVGSRSAPAALETATRANGT